MFCFLNYVIQGKEVAVNKDRRGELFYYMHHQVMSRYNTERVCNGLAQAQPLMDFRENLPEGYFPKMDNNVAGRAWPGRPANMALKDLSRTVHRLTVRISDLEPWRDRILEAVRA